MVVSFWFTKFKRTISLDDCQNKKSRLSSSRDFFNKARVGLGQKHIEIITTVRNTRSSGKHGHITVGENLRIADFIRDAMILLHVKIL